MGKISFISGMVPDASVDVVFKMCPMHLMETEEKMKELEEGQVLEVITDYEGSLDDIPDWCEKTGNELIGLDDTGEFFKFYIRKRGD